MIKKVDAPWCAYEEEHAAPDQNPWDRYTHRGPVFVYRFYRHDGALFCVGMTRDMKAPMQTVDVWMTDVCHWRTQVDSYDNEVDANEAAGGWGDR